MLSVFTEQGSSQMMAAKIMDIMSRLPGCAGQAADAVSAHTRSQWKMHHHCSKNSEVQMSRYLDTSTKTKMAQIMVQYGRPSRSS